MAIPFVNEPPPEPGHAVPVAPGVLRLTARNSGPLTYHGTNSYIVSTGDEYVIVDPGPDDADHIASLLSVTGRRVAALLVTHGHGDHVEATGRLSQETGAPICGFVPSIDPHCLVDIPLTHGDTVHGLNVLHTPGHAPDHLCFATANGVLFSGDHVMTWSTSAVSPPRGSMTAYRNSLSLLLERDYRLLLPGHGAPSHEPMALMRALLFHRLEREQRVLNCVRNGTFTPQQIVNRIYSKLHPMRRGPAERTVTAYLLALEEVGLVRLVHGRWLPR